MAKKKKKTNPIIDIYDLNSFLPGSLDLSVYSDPTTSPYYSSISTSVGTVPMTYTLPSADTKDKQKFDKFINKHGVKPLKEGESAVMIIDDGKGNRYSMIDLIEATDSPLNTVMYEVMINNFRSLQNINKKLSLICHKLDIGNDKNDTNK